MGRRLAAIVSIDVVGYTRLMRADEAGTLAALTALRTRLVEPKVTQHHGRTIKLMGDGALLEFPSVIDAVLFAVDVQFAARASGTAEPADRAIVFRIGINLGDVIAEDDDIYGDGVNLAARIEALAEPGGICISRPVYDQVRDKLDLDYEDMGEVEVKNIDRPVRVFRIPLTNKAAALLRPVNAAEAPTPPRARRLAAAAAVALLAIAAAGIAWWQVSAPDLPPASLERMALPLPEEPSIAVLPFDNLTGDPSQDYWIDGFTEDLITTLSKVPRLFVIARNSTFAYKDKPTKVQEVAEALGVRYVLEGSTQLVGDRVRINAQLIDALSGRHLWSERYDRDFSDILVLQDDIGRRIVTEIEVELTMGEDARIYRQNTDSAAAYLHVMRGRELFQHFDKADNQTARREFEQALELDPDYANAASWLGWTHWNDARYRWSADRGESLRMAEDLGRRALTLDSEWEAGHGLMGAVHLLKGDFDQSLAERRKALEISPGTAENQYMMGWTLVYAGDPDEAIEHLRRALRLSPFAPAHWASSLGEAYRLSGRADEAVAVLRGVAERAPEDINVSLIRLAAALVAAGQEDEAREVADKILRIKPTFSLSDYAKSRIYRDPQVTERLITDLRKTGLPDQR